ncbi:MAG: hypothetical protein ACFFCW_40275 [Candidatus Hodarchaeota archaeon]
MRERPRCRKEIDAIIRQGKASLLDTAYGYPRFEDSPKIFFSERLRKQARKMLAEQGLDWQKALKKDMLTQKKA